jgi:GT2 family glycosyltransferase
MPDLTISIVAHNSREQLLACLDSLAGTAAEIVVLDNASEDGTAEAVRELFPGVRLIVQPFRAGFGANHNTVIRATSSRYVWLLNPDTTAVDWCFDRMVAYLDAHPRVAALGPKLIYPDGSDQVSAWRFPTPLVQVLGLLTLNRVGVRQSGSRPRAVGWVMGAALLLRRSALDEVGLFDEDFFLYTEEVDLQFRLHRAGWEVHCFPEVTVVHHESQLGVLMPARRINEMWRSAHRYWRKHHSPAGARVAALCLGTQCVIRALLTLLAGRDRAKAKSLLLHAQNTWRVAGPGLRELAEEWNRRAFTTSVGRTAN